MSKSKMTWKGAVALKPYLVEIGPLKVYEENERLHDERNLAAIEMSLKTHGQMRLLIVYGGEVFAGNGRLAAAKRLGWTHVAVMSVDDLFESRTQARAFAIADNRTGELATWDIKKLSERMAAIPEDIRPWTGFEDFEFKALVDSSDGWKAGTATTEQPQATTTNRQTIRIKIADPGKLAIIRDALDRLRKIEDDPTIKDGRALELIAANFVL